MNIEGQVVLLNYREDGTTPYLVRISLFLVVQRSEGADSTVSSFRLLHCLFLPLPLFLVPCSACCLLYLCPVRPQTFWKDGLKEVKI